MIPFLMTISIETISITTIDLTTISITTISIKAVLGYSELLHSAKYKNTIFSRQFMLYLVPPF